MIETVSTWDEVEESEEQDWLEEGEFVFISSVAKE